MHARLIVLVNREDDDNSERVRSAAERRLRENGFAGKSGLFSSPPADWFNIGGRWSGQLTWWQLPDGSEEKFYEEATRRCMGWYGKNRTKEQDKEELINLFKEMFPDFQGLPPVARDVHECFGYKDDAQILDELLFEKLETLHRFNGHLYNGDCYVDLDEPYEKLAQNAIGRKWVIVVDFRYTRYGRKTML